MSNSFADLVSSGEDLDLTLLERRGAPTPRDLLVSRLVRTRFLDAELLNLDLTATSSRLVGIAL
ncbi:MAG: hypothetical protein R3E97_23575 [Candidatus Eisenbacteria bacterium]